MTVQAQILELIERLQRELGTAIVLITHDLGVVAEVADDIVVMYAGQVVEHGPREAIFADPQHPYTWGLLGSLPRLDARADEPLVPIPGQPPSLINRADGLRVPPALPATCEEEHKRIVPPLEPGRRRARATRRACLLPERSAATRSAAARSRRGETGPTQALGARARTTPTGARRRDA